MFSLFFIFNNFNSSLNYFNCTILATNFCRSCISGTTSKLIFLLLEMPSLIFLASSPFSVVNWFSISVSALCFASTSSNMNMFLQCFLRGHLQQQSYLFSLASSILDLLVAIILTLNLHPTISVTSTRIRDTDSSHQY